MGDLVRVNEFFRRAGLRLNSGRKSWGAADAGLVLLRTWAHDSSASRESVVVLKTSNDHPDLSHPGLRERLLHVKRLWEEGVPGYTVLWEAKDPNASPRQGKPFNETVVYPIQRLRVGSDGFVRAALGRRLALAEIREHSRQHRTNPARGRLPFDSDFLDALAKYRPHGGGGAGDSLKQRARRFAQTEIRPEQRAFREAVFAAYGGQCPLTNCLVPEALEAAHLQGRKWREGQNEAKDGILLRRDVHALYDKGLVAIARSGRVTVEKQVEWEYGHLRTVRVVFKA